MWTLHPKHKMTNSGFLFHRTPFDREYPHPLNDFFWRVKDHDEKLASFVEICDQVAELSVKTTTSTDWDKVLFMESLGKIRSSV